MTFERDIDRIATIEDDLEAIALHKELPKASKLAENNLNRFRRVIGRVIEESQTLCGIYNPDDLSRVIQDYKLADSRVLREALKEGLGRKY